MATSAVVFLSLVACGTRAAVPPAEPPTEVIVSAAASLTDALNKVQPLFKAENPAVTLRFNFGSSGALQQQMEKGAPVDLFIAAAPGPMDALVARGLVDRSAVHTLVSNRIVLIRSQSGGDPVLRTWDDLKSEKVSRIAIGNPEHVPAGQYGKAVLQKLDLWDTVAKKLVYAEDVRQVLQFVESGEAQAGIVYSTDAATSQKVAVSAEAPAGSHPPITYPMAVLKGSRHAAQAQALADYLLSARGRAVLKQYGFGGVD